jgi:hypothetical protein
MTSAAADGAVLPEQLIEVGVRGAVAEIPDVQLAAHVIAPNASLGPGEPGWFTLAGSR